ILIKNSWSSSRMSTIGDHSVADISSPCTDQSAKNESTWLSSASSSRTGLSWSLNGPHFFKLFIPQLPCGQRLIQGPRGGLNAKRHGRNAPVQHRCSEKTLHTGT